MENQGPFVSRHGIEAHGLDGVRTAYWNLPVPRLYEEAIRRDEGVITAGGPLLAVTGRHTGRSPNDRFIIREPGSEERVWWGKVNRGLARESFDALHAGIRGYFDGRDAFVFDGWAGADPRYRLPVRVVSELAWHSLFARNMFVREDSDALLEHDPGFTVISAPGFHADPAKHGTDSPTFIVIDIGHRTVLIGGSRYAGEIKKSIFTVMNYLLPLQGVLSMHCSANYGSGQDDVALFFGLSGTGKTTLSADSERTLIGDDEHGWSDDGVFNLEGGCYAKVIRLSPEGEPEIYATTRQFGTILENVVADPESRRLDLDDGSLTENTRASYPLDSLASADADGCAGHPRNLVLLTCDAFGVLPPLSRLTEAQTLYHFLSGYTAKVAGTERGVTEPSATFSTCFGAPFMPLHPSVYAEMLGAKMRRHGARAWLVNTGWTGGPPGVGRRIALAHTRRMVRAALSGELDDADTTPDPVFGLAAPRRVEAIPDTLLRPRDTWQDPDAYDRRAADLARMFNENFAKYADGVEASVRAAGPRS